MSSFTELQEMIAFIEPNKIKHIKRAVFADEGKMLELYEGIADGTFETEVKAKRHFYPKKKNQTAYFNRLKRNLQEKLTDLIILTDHTQSPFESPNKGYAYCAKKLALVNIWFYLQPSLSGVTSIVEKAMRVAQHHQFADMIFFIARFCYIHYSVKNNWEKTDFYEELLNKYSGIFVPESRIDIIGHKLTYLVKKTAKSIPKEQQILLRNYFDEIQEIRNQFSSYRINTRGIMTQVLLLSFLKDDAGKLVLLKEAIREAKAIPGKYPLTYQDVFYGEAMEIHIKRKNFAKAKDLFHEHISKIDPGHQNWFIFNRHLLTTSIHSKDYRTAYEISEVLSNHPALRNKITATFQQRFYITFAHVHILIRTGRVPGVRPEESDFSVKRFLKSVPNYRYDTGGFGFSVNIVVFVHWLIDKNYDDLIEKRDSLITYTSKHLKDEGAARARYFLRMLIAIVTKDFSRIRVEAHVKDRRLLNKLRKKPLAETKQELSLEIIPFEDLWQIVLELLD